MVGAEGVAAMEEAGILMAVVMEAVTATVVVMEAVVMEAVVMAEVEETVVVVAAGVMEVGDLSVFTTFIAINWIISPIHVCGNAFCDL